MAKNLLIVESPAKTRTLKKFLGRDYAVVSFAEYQQWLERPDAEPSRAVVSDDREVALICLRSACPRPQ